MYGSTCAKRILPLCVAIGACAPAYQLPSLSPEWIRVEGRRTSQSFHHRLGGTIATEVTCRDSDDVPLDILTRHLLFGVANQEERSWVEWPLAGRLGRRTVVSGVLDGIPLLFDLAVIRRDHCTYDLMLIATAKVFQDRQRDFDRLLADFRLGAQP